MFIRKLEKERKSANATALTAHAAYCVYLIGDCVDFVWICHSKRKKRTFKIESKSHFNIKTTHWTVFDSSHLVSVGWYLFGISKWSRIEPSISKVNTFYRNSTTNRFICWQKAYFTGNHEISLFIQIWYWKTNKFHWAVRWWCVPIIAFWWSKWWIFTRVVHTHIRTWNANEIGINR